MHKYLLLLLLPLGLIGQSKPNQKIQWDHGFRGTSFYMTTQNGIFGPHSGLKDFYTYAVGAEYLAKARWKNWNLNVDFYGTTLVSGNAFEKDSLTGKASRYESGLLAVDAPEQTVIAVPSVLELTYQKGNLKWGLGNFALKGTFLNKEHGRMIPSTFSGTHLNYKIGQVSLQGALVTHVAARSTSGFKSVAESLAQYNPGLDTSGSKHDKTQVETWGLLYGQLEWTHNIKNWYGEFQNEWTIVPGVFGTAVFNEVLAHGNHLWQVQYIRQFKLGNGGNDDPYLAYFQQNSSQYFGAKYSHKVGDVHYFSAASYITAQGKLLSPREWGREYLVTFQPRERQEGMGNTFAIVGGAEGNWKEGKVSHSGGVSTGVYVRPEPSNYVLNKYGMPSNQQTNLWWKQSWKGGRHQLLSLLVLKVPLSSSELTAGQTINKVDMLHVSMVYRFTILPM